MESQPIVPEVWEKRGLHLYLRYYYEEDESSQLPLQRILRSLKCHAQKDKLSLVWFKKLLKNTFSTIKLKGNHLCIGLRERDIIPHIGEIFKRHGLKVVINNRQILTGVNKIGKGTAEEDLFLKITIDKRTGNFSVGTNYGVVANRRIFGYQSIPVHDPVVVEEFIKGLKRWSICPGLGHNDKNSNGDKATASRAPACYLLVSCKNQERKRCCQCDRSCSSGGPKNHSKRRDSNWSDEAALGDCEELDENSAEDGETYLVSDTESHQGDPEDADISSTEVDTEARGQLVSSFDIDIRSSVLYDQLREDALGEGIPALDGPHKEDMQYQDEYALATDTRNVGSEASLAKTQKVQLTFECRQCRKEFTSRDAILSHMLSHVKGNCCKLCQKSFHTRSLKRHLLTHVIIKQRVQVSTTTYECSICGKKYDKSVAYRAHRLLHGVRKPHACSLCCKAFAVKEHCDLHMEVRHQKRVVRNLEANILGGSNKCHRYRRTFRVPNKLRIHSMSHRGQVYRACKMCPAKFSQKCNFIIHRTKHPSWVPYECSKCHRTFKYYPLLCAHALHHEKPKFRCPKCTRKFPLKEMLSIHYSRVHGRTPSKNNPEKSRLMQVMQLSHGSAGCPVCCEKRPKNRSLRLYLLKHKSCLAQFNTKAVKGAGNSGKIGGFHCKSCAAHFATQSQLRKHIKTHVKEKNLSKNKKGKRQQLSCCICGKQFFQESQLRKHELSHLEVMLDGRDEVGKSTKRSERRKGSKVKERSFMCDVCGKAFYERRHLTEHSSTHNYGERPYQCDDCPKKFYRRSLLDQHKRTHTGERPYFCEICHQSFHARGSFNEHSRLHWENRPFSCSICGKGFIRQSRLIEHQNIHTDHKPYECNVCCKTFRFKDTLIRHIKTKHKEKEFLCEICSKEFAYKRDYLTHKVRVHGGAMPEGVNRPQLIKETYPCSVCGKTYSSRANMERHEYLHRDPKPFKCTLCEKSFSEKRYLLNHMVSHSGQKAFECTVCHKGFTMKSHLVTHMKSHSTIKPYQCMECHKSFTLKHTLEAHLWTHREHKPFKCSFCDRQFVKQHLFNKHILEHSGQQPRVETSSYQELTPVIPGVDASQWTTSVPIIPVPTMDIINWSQTHQN